jgi:hypothetical protein
MATIDTNALQATLDRAVAGAARVPLWMAVPASLPLLATLWARHGGRFSGMTVGRAVAVFSIVGGAAGVTANYLAGMRLDQTGAPINVLDMIPAVVGSILATAGATWLLLPPAKYGQVWAEFVDAVGL